MAPRTRAISVRSLLVLSLVHHTEITTKTQRPQVHTSAVALLRVIRVLVVQTRALVLGLVHHAAKRSSAAADLGFLSHLIGGFRDLGRILAGFVIPALQ